MEKLSLFLTTKTKFKVKHRICEKFAMRKSENRRNKLTVSSTVIKTTETIEIHSPEISCEKTKKI